jgi:hypothetical protein
MLARLLVALIPSALTGFVVAVAATALAAHTVSLWSGDDAFRQALSWRMLNTYGLVAGVPLGMVVGAAGYLVWLRRIPLADLLRAAPVLFAWTVLGGALSGAVLFPLTVLGAPWAFFAACARLRATQDRLRI